ncbi:hypothetical protein KDA_24900 [Dictyobacter alpinus]|uniref:Uncharacterized protein n=1 Tax=Dictyobacter alpinus TaxID=2014873 RepID=A0A402B6M9_9CHLR|nr:hypothetical protein KDA_24900 [Dictyobacter alpinus]
MFTKKAESQVTSYTLSHVWSVCGAAAAAPHTLHTHNPAPQGKIK